MKRALVLLLLVWIALQSALVQAHLVEESLHHFSHSVQVSGDDVADAADADIEQGEACTVVVCSHPVGTFNSQTPLCWGQRSCSPPSTVLPLQSAHAPDDIERPQWPAPASGVAGI